MRWLDSRLSSRWLWLRGWVLSCGGNGPRSSKVSSLSFRTARDIGSSANIWHEANLTNSAAPTGACTAHPAIRCCLPRCFAWSASMRSRLRPVCSERCWERCASALSIGWRESCFQRTLPWLPLQSSPCIRRRLRRACCRCPMDRFACGCCCNWCSGSWRVDRFRNGHGDGRCLPG